MFLTVTFSPFTVIAIVAGKVFEGVSVPASDHPVIHIVGKVFLNKSAKSSEEVKDSLLLDKFVGLEYYSNIH